MIYSPSIIFSTTRLAGSILAYMMQVSPNPQLSHIAAQLNMPPLRLCTG